MDIKKMITWMLIPDHWRSHQRLKGNGFQYCAIAILGQDEQREVKSIAHLFLEVGKKAEAGSAVSLLVEIHRQDAAAAWPPNN